MFSSGIASRAAESPGELVNLTLIVHYKSWWICSPAHARTTRSRAKSLSSWVLMTSNWSWTCRESAVQLRKTWVHLLLCHFIRTLGGLQLSRYLDPRKEQEANRTNPQSSSKDRFLIVSYYPVNVFSRSSGQSCAGGR